MKSENNKRRHGGPESIKKPCGLNEAQVDLEGMWQVQPSRTSKGR